MKTKILNLFLLTTLCFLIPGIYKNLARAEEPLCGLESVVCPGETYLPIQASKAPEIVKFEEKKVYTVEDTKNYIRDSFNKAGLDGNQAVAISGCESKWKLDAINYNGNKTCDKGIWQINDIHNISDSCRFDLICSTQWAIEKVKKDNGFSAWVCLNIIDNND